MRPNRTISEETYAILLMLATRVRQAREAKRTLLESRLKNYAEGAAINALITYKQAKKLIK